MALLSSGRVFLMDGAMGTELQRAGLREGECAEAWNLERPERVRLVHAAYVGAGAQILVTNTFQANPVALARVGRETELERMYAAGVGLARSAGGRGRLVLAGVGPVPSEMGLAQALFDGWLARVARAARAADGLLLETLSAWMIAPMMSGLRAAWGRTRAMPVWVSVAYVKGPRGAVRTFDDVPAEVVAEIARREGAAGLGVNCGTAMGVRDVAGIVRAYREATGLAVVARPNAGTPTRGPAGWSYPVGPRAMAEALPELLREGVAGVGGCCGTTPAHVAAFRPVVEEWNAQRPLGYPYHRLIK